MAVLERSIELSEALMRLGWTPERETEFETHREDGLLPARVAVEHRSAYVLYGEQGELRAELAGRLRHEEIWPAVGDWVAVRPPATIVALLARKTVFSRKEPWLAAKEQVLAANADTVFVTTALTPADFKPRRLERYQSLGERFRPSEALKTLFESPTSPMSTGWRKPMRIGSISICTVPACPGLG